MKLLVLVLRARLKGRNLYPSDALRVYVQDALRDVPPEWVFDRVHGREVYMLTYQRSRAVRLRLAPLGMPLWLVDPRTNLQDGSGNETTKLQAVP